MKSKLMPKPMTKPTSWPARTALLAASCALAGTLGSAFSNAAQEQSAELQAGRQKAQACNVCHGPAGISQAPDTPHIAGQPVIYLTAQLKAYRNGTRKHEVMAVMAKPLTDDDIAALAAWYSSIKIEATAPGS